MPDPSTPITRRRLLGHATESFASLALAALLAREARAEAAAGRGPGGLRPHHAPRAKSVICLYMEGGPSQLDTFDHKPRLAQDHGKPIPFRTPNTVFNIGRKILRSPFEFRRHGESGGWVSEIFPHVARCVDKLTVLHGLHHGVSNHSSACYMTHTGHAMVGKPSMGSWLTYGLGSECRDLPGFVVLDCGQGPSGGPPTWGSGFLPVAYQGTIFTSRKEPLDYIRPLETSARIRARKIATLQELQNDSNDRFEAHRLVTAQVESYEHAFRMQSAVPDLLDISGETAATRRLYGLDDAGSELFGSRCLLARRLVERGVRFVEVLSPKVKADRWDQHSNLEEGHRRNAALTDRGVAGLITDLDARGLLDETIVLWGGEFGRTPNAQGKNGRDHNPYGYTVWVAGGGFRPGIRHGKTDDFGYFAVDDKVHLHDLHATILHQLGLDHTRLTYRFSGRDFRLTDVHGEVIRPILL